ncbi:hypothetical protein PG993_008716 [Apiospora rasikravindrae]|uniref:Uncharacterized protein n=1 Tax=Apiospora rasikravindrae TaxID=990691 RepID=A0ABR1SP83_9PEZI
MCHGHPHYHTCHHTSVKWLYCPEAMFDLETGYETPCSNPIYSTPQLASSECPLQNCLFKQLKGDRWTCCRCGHNANKEGWCVGKINHPFGSWTPRGLEPQNWQTCGHGYCGKCSRDLSSSRAGTPIEQVVEQRKGRSGRKSGFHYPRSSHVHAHKRGLGDDYGGTYTVEEYVLSPVAGSARTSKASSLDPGHDASHRKTITSSREKKKGRRTHH